MTDYVELHAHSCYSLLDGAAFPEDLAARAAALGMGALALTDHDAVYGAPRFVAAAQAQGVRPLLGAELTLEGGHHLTLLVEDEVGWGHLCTLISLGRANAPKGESLTPWEALAGRTGGLIALSGCRKGVVAALLLRGDREGALAAARRYRDLFGAERYYIELQRQLLPDDERLTGDLAEIATQLGLGCAVSNDAHYAARDGHRLQDVLVCIRHLTTLDASARLRRPNSEWYLKSAAEMAALFPDHPEALRNTIEIAERCRFQLRCGLQDLPRFPTPGDVPTEAYLRQLAEEGLRRRWGEPSARALAQLERELAVIAQGGLSNYFLIVWDLVRHAREQGILCQGRGSAANSLVAYLLGITPIDPLAHDLVFERFLSAERAAAPDIDIDFQADRREEVIQYAYRRYGTAHAAMACTLITFQARSARRDVGKALGLSPEAVQQALAVEEAGDN
ncbi:MAG: DNA polymerase III subunit alpha, partial [Chloroflexi bacterium]|nr:DNA polymerase III subunit alpha [Chloroflexota bacterium]